MPSLKELLTSLFKLSGSQAMPSADYVDLGVPPNGNWSELYTASFDGYVVLFGIQCTAIEISNITTGLRVKTETSISSGIFIPVRKGDQFNVFANYSNTTEFWFRLVKTIGSS